MTTEKEVSQEAPMPKSEEPKKKTKTVKTKSEKVKHDPNKTKQTRKRRPYKKLDKAQLEQRINKLSTRIERCKNQEQTDDVLLTKYLFEKQCREEEEKAETNPDL